MELNKVEISELWWRIKRLIFLLISSLLPIKGICLKKYDQEISQSCNKTKTKDLRQDQNKNKFTSSVQLCFNHINSKIKEDK